MTTATQIATLIDGKLTLDADLKDKIVQGFLTIADAFGVATDPVERAEWVRQQLENKTPVLTGVLKNAIGYYDAD
jgi:hypothetical protein